MCIKFIFLNSPNEGGYVKPIKSHFSLNFCSRKQKYLLKRYTFRFSAYSVLSRGINRQLMCIKIIFLNSPDKGDYVNRINLHFL